MTCALAFLLFATQSDERLVEQLKSNDIQERAGAQAQLISRGRSSLPFLKKHESDPDAEWRGRIRDTISEIERRERISAVRPPVRKVTLDLRDSPLLDAVEQVFSPFGLRVDQDSFADLDVKKNLVTLRLENASLWKAHRSLQTAAGIELDFHNSSGIRLSARPRPKSIEHSVETEEVRLQLYLDLPKDAEPEGSAKLRIVATLPPDSGPGRWTVEEPHLTGDQGNDIEWRRDRFLATDDLPVLIRRPGVLDAQEAWSARVDMKNLKDVARIHFSGKFRIEYPHDLQRYDIPVREGNGPFSKVINGVTCSFFTERDGAGRIRWMREKLSDSGEGKRRPFLVWFEDADGRWLGDHMALALGGSKGESGGAGGLNLENRERIANLVLVEYVGQDRVVVPFDFKDVPVRSANK